MGVKRGRLVVAFDPVVEDVSVKVVNGTTLKKFKDNDWRAQDRRYGERGCRYVEYPLPPLPATVRASARFQGKIVAKEDYHLSDENIPAAAIWQDKYVLKAPKKPKELSAAKARPALPQRRPGPTGGAR
mmetsp:Transcript_41292/g.106850  ORF Transcript_41292/g.106850 Transcript_41292/m.106850 type:complete len:129 (+) Transcript_41292:152-538(+)